MKKTDFLSYLEVTPDEYKGFISQLKKDCFIQEIQEFDEGKILGIISKKTGKLVCGTIIDIDDNISYYVIEMPDADERRAAPAIRKIVLTDKKEVQSFFEILNKMINEKENSKND